MDELGTISVLVNGALGRMGRVIVPAIEQAGDMDLAGATDVSDDLKDFIRSVHIDVGIDFTVPGAVMGNACLLIDNGVRPVIGTTGLTVDQVKELQERCRRKKLGGIIAPNFCIGAVLMMKFSVEAAKYFPDMEIVELHHERKIDSPSGTSLRTAQMISQVRGNVGRGRDNGSGETVSGCRGGKVNGIPIHSVRLPGLLAHQAVMFGGQGEVLTVRHDVMNRESFTAGVLLAVREVMKRNELIVGLEHII